MPKLSKQLFISLLVLFLPVTAFADEVWQIYGYANADQLHAILQAIDGWMSEGSFRTFVIAVVLAGYLGASVMGFTTGDPKKVGGYILGIIIASHLLFNEKISLNIKDQITNKMHSKIEVSAAAGLPLAVISEVGAYISDSIESTFQGTDAGGDGNGYPSMSSGMPFGGTYGVMRDITNFRIMDTRIRSNVTTYVRYCFIPYINTWYVPDQILGADNFWEAIKGGKNGKPPVNQYIEYQTEEGGRELKACDEAHAIITTDLDKHVPSMLKRFSGSGQVVADALADADTSALVTKWAVDSAAKNTNMAINSAMMEATREGFQRTAHALDSDTLMVALNTENARRAQTAGWYTTAVLFRDMMGYFFAILQGFIIAITPLVAIMAFMPGMGLKMIGGYAKVLVWMTMWWPALAIVNFIMNSYYKSKLGGAGMLCSDAIAGCSSSIGLMSDATQNMMIAAGLMATFVPAIMWGIISQGSFALTSVLDRASGAGYATQAGGNIAHGSARFGDIGMNNVNMNKHDTTWQNSSGVAPSQQIAGAGQSVTLEQQGGVGSTVAGNVNTRTMGQQYSRGLDQLTAREKSYQKSASSSINHATAQIASERNSLDESGTYVEGVGTVFENREAAERARSLDEQAANMYKHAVASEMMTQEEAAESLKAKFGAGAGRIFNIAFGTEATEQMKKSGKLSSSESDDYSYSTSEGDRTTLGHSSNVSDSAAERRELATRGSHALSEDTQNAITRAFNEVDAYTEAVKNTENFKESYGHFENSTYQMDASLSDRDDAVLAMQIAAKQMALSEGALKKELTQGQADVEGAGDNRVAAVTGARNEVVPRAQSFPVDEEDFRNTFDGTVGGASNLIHQAKTGVAHVTDSLEKGAMTGLNNLGDLSIEEAQTQVSNNQARLAELQESLDGEGKISGWLNAGLGDMVEKEVKMHETLNSVPGYAEEFQGIVANKEAAIAAWEEEVYRSPDNLVGANKRLNETLEESYFQPLAQLQQKAESNGRGDVAGVISDFTQSTEKFNRHVSGGYASVSGAQALGGANDNLLGGGMSSIPRFARDLFGGSIGGEARDNLREFVNLSAENARLESGVALANKATSITISGTTYTAMGTVDGGLAFEVPRYDKEGNPVMNPDTGKQEMNYYSANYDGKQLSFTPVAEDRVVEDSRVREAGQRNRINFDSGMYTGDNSGIGNTKR